MSEKYAVVSAIDPDANAAATYNGNVIDMQDFEQVMFVLSVGEMDATSTVDYGIYGDTASGGSFATLLTGKSITQLTAAGTDDDKQVVVSVTQDEATNQGFRYIQDEMVVGTAASDAGAIALAEVRFVSAADYDLSTVDEIVA